MRTYVVSLLAVVALVAAACTADENGSPGASPTGTLDLDLSPTATATDASPEASPTESAADTMDASPTESPDDTASPDATGSPRTTEDASPTASPDDDDGLGGTAGVTCEEAFEDVPDLSRIDSLQQLQEAFEALDATIEACDSVTEWTGQAEEQLDLGNLDLDAEEFLRDRCDESDALSGTALCEEL